MKLNKNGRWVSWLLLVLYARSVYAYPIQDEASINPNRSLPITEGVKFEQKLGAQIPQDLLFRNDKGEELSLGHYLGKRPLILAMVYFSCPNLCTMVINGVFKVLAELPFQSGKELSVLFVSIDPTETPVLSAIKKQNYLKRHHMIAQESGLHFLTGNKASIDALANAVGFHYVYDLSSKQYAHPSGIMVISPEGRISRYFYGIEYSSQDLRLAVNEASEERIGPLTNVFLLLCFHYDPVSGAYTLAIWKVLRVSGFLCFAFLIALIAWMLKRDKIKRKAL